MIFHQLISYFKAFNSNCWLPIPMNTCLSTIDDDCRHDSWSLRRMKKFHINANSCYLHLDGYSQWMPWIPVIITVATYHAHGLNMKLFCFHVWWNVSCLLFSYSQLMLIQFFFFYTIQSSRISWHLSSHIWTNKSAGWSVIKFSMMLVKQELISCLLMMRKNVNTTRQHPWNLCFYGYINGWGSMMIKGIHWR